MSPLLRYLKRNFDNISAEIIGGLAVVAIAAFVAAAWHWGWLRQGEPGAESATTTTTIPTTTSRTDSTATHLPVPGPTVRETTGGDTHTWTDYTNAGGEPGEVIASNTTVEVRCRVEGFEVESGNTWWYRIASAPWNDEFYASADAFYNNGETSGTLIGTPYVDETVPRC